jgi:hypothetical protein
VASEFELARRQPSRSRGILLWLLLGGLAWLIVEITPTPTLALRWIRSHDRIRSLLVRKSDRLILDETYSTLRLKIAWLESLARETLTLKPPRLRLA